jgi:flagellar hook assembly protein FlgD
VADGRTLGGGANVVRWDGRDDKGATVEDGMYIVSVRALGETRSRTVAVAR